MNLTDAKNKIKSYLASTKHWPLIVDFQTKQDLSDAIDYFEIGDNEFCPAERFCGADGILKTDELFAAINHNTGNTFYIELSGFLKVTGETHTRTVLKSMITTSITGHVVVFTYQCKNYLKFSDPRLLESGRIVIVDATPDIVSTICFVSPSLKDAFPAAYLGAQKLGHAVETCKQDCAYILTDLAKSFFADSVFSITQLDSGYKMLCERDHRTSVIPESFGTPEQWNYVLQRMGNRGNWSTVIQEKFGSESNLASALSGYALFDETEKWLYYVALSICGAKDNAYLQMAIVHTVKANELVKSIYRAILAVDKSANNFEELYNQRKELLLRLKDTLAEVIDFCKVVSVKAEDAIYYLTDSSQPERERIVRWLSTYGHKYSSAELVELLKQIYPDLSRYLTTYRFRNTLLDSYFEAYKYQKVINRIMPSFENVVNEQSTKLGFVSALNPRASIIDKLDVSNARAFFVDALGVEFLGFIQEKCREYGLSTNITCGRCELPSLTSFNKEFVETLNNRGCPVFDVKDLDEVKHHGEDNFDYEKEKTPLYLIRELEIIDSLLKRIRASILGGQYSKAVIISDHGASRLSVLHETENIWSMATSGEHSGRCCQVSELNSKPDYAIEDNGYWVLANYDRFKGGRRANVEVHGGASLEEVAVPVIEITQKLGNIEAFIVDDSRIVLLGAKEHAAIRVYVGIKSNNIAIKLDDRFFDAEPTNEEYIYCIDLPEYTHKGVYNFDIVNGNDILAIGQRFEIKKKGMSEVSLFD